MTNATDPVWMTPAALAALEAELGELTAGTDDEVDRARMLELRELIRRAEVGAKPDDGLVEPGMTITVRFEGDGSTETFLLGSRDLVRHDTGIDVDVYSPSSPLGVAIDGRRVGDAVRYETPGGSTLEVTILAAVPFG